MAFTPAAQLRRTRSNASYQNDTSSLVEHANSLLSESQSLWVLFNPSHASTEVGGSDVLSMTVDSQAGHEEDFQHEQDDDEEDEGQIDDKGAVYQHQQGKADALSAANNNRKERLEEMLFNYAGLTSLHKRVNRWKQLQDLPPVESVDDDNIASWDLDENIITELLEQSTTPTLSREASFLSVAGANGHVSRKPFYGDDMFQSYSKRDIVRFKKIANGLKGSLSRRNTDASSSVSYLMAKLLETQQHQQQQQQRLGESQYAGSTIGLQWKRYSTLVGEMSTGGNGGVGKNNEIHKQKYLSTIIENQIRNSLFSHHEAILQHDVHSSTASSSLVMCGGGYGTSSSWNEI